MIVLFHIIHLFTRYFVNTMASSVRKYKANKELFEPRNNNVCNTADNISFNPPVYVQRYDAVYSLLIKENWPKKIEKVVDFGCAENGFLQYLKKVEGLTEVVEVDIDENVLLQYESRAAPQLFDYLDKSRAVPLVVNVVVGSVSRYDPCLSNTDAVVAIELIEHLYPDVLNDLPYNIFGLIQPQLAIFTTPNADFNVLFHSTGFRHYDHKFEWTRREFTDWADNIVIQYPTYKVSFQGIGAGPPGTDHLGCCSQMAVFERTESPHQIVNEEELHNQANSFKILKSHVYPANVDTRTAEEKIVHEVQFQLGRLNLWLPDSYNFDDCVEEVPITLVLRWVKEWCTCQTELIEILTRHNMIFKERDGETLLVYEGSDDDTSEDQDWLPGEISSRQTEPLEEDWDAGIEKNQELCQEWITGETWRIEPLEEDWDGGVVKHEVSSNVMSQSEVNQRVSSINMMSQSEVDSCGKQPRKRPLVELSKKVAGGGVRLRKPLARPHSSYIRKSPRKISKSFSLDSCLENINCEPVQVQAFYLNLIAGGARRSSSRLQAESSSPLVDSWSCERAIDSGYPFSFSPHDTDLTLGQVDEMASARSSTSEESFSQDEQEVPEAEAAGARDLRGVFIEDPVVENGDVANNNRDGEGNNVEGLVEMRPMELQLDRNDNNVIVMPQVELPFPPWLLNIGDLAHGMQPPPLPPPAPLLAFYPDEGVGDDSSSDLDLDDLEDKSNNMAER